MGKNAIVGQSGGPTSVINASLAGVFESCKSRGAQVVYGMCNGVAGLLEERVVDLGKLLTYSVKAYDEVDKICEGTHGRAIIELDKFLSRVNKKGTK